MSPEEISFTLTTPRKRGFPEQLSQALFASFPHNNRLCPVDTLRHYVKATRNVRPVFPSSKPDLLFVSYVKPHNTITSPTISRWLRTVLRPVYTGDFCPTLRSAYAWTTQASSAVAHVNNKVGTRSPSLSA